MKKIGRYEIRGLLGKGGMGRVYKARLPALGRIVALKALAPHPFLEGLMGLDRLAEIFSNEARIMGGLRHPNLLEVLDFDFHENMPFFTMSYYGNDLGRMMGENYAPRLPSRPLLADKALHYTRQMLSGLSCLHEAGIVHRDIKPYNVLITEQDQAKITDFGLSRLRGETFVGPKNLKVGSPYYAAPEQEQDPDAATPASDLYAVGVTFFRMLSGRLPTPDCPPVHELVPDLDRDWDSFFQTALARAPERRFADGKAMHSALEDLALKWEQSKDQACRIAPQPQWSPGVSDLPPAREIRHDPVKIRPDKAREFFGLDNLWRPLNLTRSQFSPKPDNTIADQATGLTWQRGGTDYPHTRPQALAFVEKLNLRQHKGRQDWRLPTVDELATLITPAHRASDLCTDPVFSTLQRSLWSADRSSFSAAYYVSLDLGYVDRQDFSAYNHVRAVAGP